MKTYLRLYTEGQTHTYSDLENYEPDAETIKGLIRDSRHTDFYSAKDGVTRHKLGKQWYNSATGRFTLRINEDRCDNPEVPTFEVLAWENLTPEESSDRFNIGGNNSIVEYPGAVYVDGIENLNLKVKEIAELIEKLELERQQKAEQKIETERKYWHDFSVDTLQQKANEILNEPGDAHKKLIERCKKFVNEYDPKAVDMALNVDMNAVTYAVAIKVLESVNL